MIDPVGHRFQQAARRGEAGRFPRRRRRHQVGRAVHQALRVRERPLGLAQVRARRKLRRHARRGPRVLPAGEHGHEPERARARLAVPERRHGHRRRRHGPRPRRLPPDARGDGVVPRPGRRTSRPPCRNTCARSNSSRATEYAPALAKGYVDPGGREEGDGSEARPLHRHHARVLGARRPAREPPAVPAGTEAQRSPDRGPHRLALHRPRAQPARPKTWTTTRSSRRSGRRTRQRSSATCTTNSSSAATRNTWSRRSTSTGAGSTRLLATAAGCRRCRRRCPTSRWR